jgi:ABC-2 type transport system ATP-binding protein
MNHYLFNARNISKTYTGHRALNDVSVDVPQQSIFGLLGPNGAGKTTLIRIINQIIAPDKGELLFNGEPLRLDHVEQIGYLPEERGLYKKMEVGEQAVYLARLKGLKSQYEIKKQMKQWFEKFDLMPWWNKKVEELSKGMQQKVQFIITVLHKPRLLIFDEPFSGFDPINVNLLKNEILKLREEGATIIFSTHNMGSVEELCDHIALINKSEKILQGEVREVKNRFSTQLYEIQLSGATDNLGHSLDNRFKLIHQARKNGTLYARIKIEDSTDSNHLLQQLLPLGHVVSFNEVIPSMNDIFIKTVTGSFPLERQATGES